jgi:predicted aconitase with swiveling domain
MLREMKARGVIPLALVFNSVNPIIAQGAAFSDLTMLAGFEHDITAALRTGDRLLLVPAQRLLRRVQAA